MRNHVGHFLSRATLSQSWVMLSEHARSSYRQDFIVAAAVMLVCIVGFLLVEHPGVKAFFVSMFVIRLLLPLDSTFVLTSLKSHAAICPRYVKPLSIT